MTEQIGIAVIGCGYWGFNYIRVFGQLPNSRVLAVCDKRTDRLHELERRLPGILLTDELEHALRLDGVEAAIICTEATTHYRLAGAALAAGKHVLVEKPLTTTVSHADALIAMAASASLTLMVGHTFLYNPGIRKLKEYIHRADLGRVYYAYAARTNLGPIRRDVDALWDLAPHDVAIFNYLLDGAPVWVSAIGLKVLNNCRPDVGFISLGYAGNTAAHIHVSWVDPNKVREVVVVGSKKRIVFNDLNPLERVRIFEKSVTALGDETSGYDESQLLIRDGDIISPRVEASEPLSNQCTHFLECIVQGTCPLSGGWEGREVVRVLEAIDHSVACNGAPVGLEVGGSNEGQREPLVSSAFRGPSSGVQIARNGRQ
jgi:predicted dehydrogenase